MTTKQTTKAPAQAAQLNWLVKQVLSSQLEFFFFGNFWVCLLACKNILTRKLKTLLANFKSIIDHFLKDEKYHT